METGAEWGQDGASVHLLCPGLWGWGTQLGPQGSALETGGEMRPIHRGEQRSGRPDPHLGTEPQFPQAQGAPANAPPTTFFPARKSP